MPNLTLGAIAKEAAKLRFRSFNITLPGPQQGTRLTIHTLPGQTLLQSSLQGAAITVAGVGSRLQGVLGLGSSSSPAGGSAPPPATATPMSFPPALFRAASNSLDDVNLQRGMHDMFSGLFDSLIDAIEYGFNQYRRTAGFVDVRINAAIATGGRLQGPPLDSLIKTAPSVAAWSQWEGMVRDAVAIGVGRQWDTLAKSVTVPGLPWYPAFVAFPGPMAPPMPNIPMPFITLPHDAMAMSPPNLKNFMKASLHGQMDYHMEFFESIAVSLQIPLQVWKCSQQIMLVMGKGPIPTFAPPYVPVGPVLMGSILPGSHISS